jgi:hypothetical protein
MFFKKDHLTSPVVSEPKAESAPRTLHSNEKAYQLFGKWYDQLAQIVALKGGPQAEPLVIIFDNHMSDTSKHRSSQRPGGNNLLINRDIGSIAIKPSFFQTGPTDTHPDTDTSGGITLDTQPRFEPEPQIGACTIEGRKGMFKVGGGVRAAIRMSTDAFEMLKNGEATLLELEEIDAVRLSPSARAVWYQYVAWFKQEGFFK